MDIYKLSHGFLPIFPLRPRACPGFVHYRHAGHYSSLAPLRLLADDRRGRIEGAGLKGNITTVRTGKTVTKYRRPPCHLVTFTDFNDFTGCFMSVPLRYNFATCASGGVPRSPRSSDRVGRGGLCPGHGAGSRHEVHFVNTATNAIYSCCGKARRQNRAANQPRRSRRIRYFTGISRDEHATAGFTRDHRADQLVARRQAAPTFWCAESAAGFACGRASTSRKDACSSPDCMNAWSAARSRAIRPLPGRRQFSVGPDHVARRRRL